MRKGTQIQYCERRSDLKPAVQRPLDGDTLAGMDTVGGDGGDERVQLVLLLLQLLHEALDGPLSEALVLPSLPVAHEAVDDAEAGVIAAWRVHRHDAADTRHRRRARYVQQQETDGNVLRLAGRSFDYYVRSLFQGF